MSDETLRQAVSVSASLLLSVKVVIAEADLKILNAPSIDKQG